MPEKLLAAPEHEELLEAHATPEKSQHTKSAESAGNAHHEEDALAKYDRLNEIRNSIKAGTSEEGKQAIADTNKHAQMPQYVDKKMKADSLKQELAAVRKQLPKSQQTLSRVVHNKGVQKVSEVGEKTFARPQALLFGGFFAVVSSCALYLTAKYIGFQYNYLVSIMCFVGGYVIGLIAELILRVLRPSHNQ
jgi:hypothetical protein